MIEVAIGFLGAYLARKAAGLLDQAGSDVDKAVDRRLGDLYEFVKGKLVNRGSRAQRALRILEKSPEDNDSQDQVAEELQAALVDDAPGAENLQTIIEDLNRLDPTGVRLRGTASAETIRRGGRSIGVDVSGRMEPGDSAEGAADAQTVEGEQAGVRYEPGTRDATQ
jgi:hypothetical protein